MSIRFRCKLCGKKLSAKPALAGRKLKCPYCRTEVTVPDEDDPSLIEPAPADASSSHEDEPPTDSPLLLFRPKEKHEDLIDMTAMVDIVFFLLIFFMVTSMAPLEAVINLPTPQAPESAANSVQTVPDYSNDPSTVVVTIDADDAVWVEDQEALSEQDLRSKLRAAIADDERDSMLVQGAADATHGKFVMVLDAGAAAGMKEIMFSVEETDDGDSG
ncbi:MAG TPA: biopolymer transporter ExbD [Lacipirellulaceae bacterium]|jgi:biopolymer transport protein ExbD/phage FluMu protein Com|nr:biopolymer transporter ExbD [Lacipirellulaceae bacterium]